MGAPKWPPNLNGGPEMAPNPPALAGPGKAVAGSISAHSRVSTVRGLISTARPIAVDGARGATHGEREPDTCRPGGGSDGPSGRRRPRQHALPPGQGRRPRPP